MERDPNHVTGLTEAELERRDLTRERTYRRRFTIQTLRASPAIMASILLTAVVIFLGPLFIPFKYSHQLLPALGGVLVGLGVCFNFQITSRIRADREQQTITMLVREATGIAGTEANKAIRMAFPNACETRTAGSEVVQTWSKQMVRLERPLAEIEFWLMFLGTIVWAFGDWALSYFHCGCVQC